MLRKYDTIIFPVSDPPVKNDSLLCSCLYMDVNTMLISPVIPYTIAKVFITIKIYIAGTIGQLMLYLLVFRLTIYIYYYYY